MLYEDEETTRTRQLASAELAMAYDAALREEARRARDSGEVQFARFTSFDTEVVVGGNDDCKI